MDQRPNKKKYSSLARLVALIAALIVIIGTIFVVFQPGKNSADSAVLPHAYAAAPTEKPWKDLKKGSSGEAVKRAQCALSALGFYEGKQDGNFSKAFEEAVLAFQQDWDLEATGVIDQDTYELITADLPENPPTPAPAVTPPATAPPAQAAATEAPSEQPFVVQGASYSDKEHVAAYLKAYGQLPPNYITKQEAQSLGWVASYGNLWEVAPGKSIGGDRFGNYEGQLPVKYGRRYFECDIDFDGSFRNAKRIIFSNDGLIFYTEDHYNTFEEIK
ncbi:MAG: peptidoglycan-binding protein [Clostridia bacterium]|nr:peptidoglycan-binding protein [Clostridia bacterium]